MRRMTDTAQFGIGATQNIGVAGGSETVEFIRPRPRPGRNRRGPSEEVVAMALATAALAGAITGIILGIPAISVPADPQLGAPEPQTRPAVTAAARPDPRPAITVLVAGPTATTAPRRTPPAPRPPAVVTVVHPSATAARRVRPTRQADPVETPQERVAPSPNTSSASPDPLPLPPADPPPPPPADPPPPPPSPPLVDGS